MITGTASVIDGDTLEIHGQRIRLLGIDAPESTQTCTTAARKAWGCGSAAANALDAQLDRNPVSCMQRDTDRYGRVVAVCSTGAEDLGAWMVRRGWAVAYRQYSVDYVGDEAAARSARRGIWAGTFDVPNEWRKAKRGGTAGASAAPAPGAAAMHLLRVAS